MILPTGPSDESAGVRPTRRLHVAHAIHSLELGGAQQIIKYLIGHGDAESFDHRIFAGKSGIMHAEIADSGARIEIIPRHIPKIDPLWALRLMRALRRERIDVLHTHLFGDSLHGVAAAMMLGGPPVVVTLHNSIRDFTALQRRGYRWLLPRASAAVACAPVAGESFRQFLSGTQAAVEVIANGLDPAVVSPPAPGVVAEIRRKLGIPPDAVVVGSLGRLVEQKGFDLVIDAFRFATRDSGPSARLVVVGDGLLRDELRAHAIRAGIESQVIWTGFRSDVRKLLFAIDVLAFGSRYEGLPMALLEGMASKRCIVVTPVPGLAEILTHETDGLVSDARTAESFGMALRRALDDAALRRRLGDGAYETFTARYTVDRMVRQYEKLYRRVLGDVAPEPKELNRRS